MVIALTVGNLSVEMLIYILATSLSQTCKYSRIKPQNKQKRKEVKFLFKVSFARIVRREFDDSSVR
ncbi:hypothetical protein [cyanobacterium endosymbiont of Epithemia turgida]|uniref:hypothetical protein n=1 Tax=cyanobacterium endosymbiont of Epithemia turgida TaxID=718217 RepID=UPI002FCBDE21